MSLWDHLPASELQPDDESARLIAEKTTSAGLARPQLARTLMEDPGVAGDRGDDRMSELEERCSS